MIKPLSSLAISLVCATTTIAQLHEGDIILKVESGAVVTGSANVDGISFPQHVFTGEFGDLGLANRTADPGFNSLPDEFVTSALVDVRVRRAVRAWSPSERNFCEIPAETIEIRKGTRTIVSPATDPADPLEGPSITVGVTDPFDGLIHQHPAYWLTTPFSDGVYLVEIQVEAAPLAPSQPVWLLFSQNAAQATVDDAVRFAEATLVDGSGNLCRCASDTNDDSRVDLIDLLDFVSEWSSLLGGPTEHSPIDVQGDGVIDLIDLLDFVERWLSGC